MERIADGLDDLLRDERRVFGADQMREQQRELVAAEAGHGVAVADARLHARRDGLQQLIADVVAERVVDDFEAIEVEEEDRQPAVIALRVRQRDGQAVLEQQAVRQAGQRVVIREVLDLLFGVRPLGDVADDADHAAALDGGERDLLREREAVAPPSRRFAAPPPTLMHDRQDRIREPFVGRRFVQRIERHPDHRMRVGVTVEFRQRVVDVR